MRGRKGRRRRQDLSRNGKDAVIKLTVAIVTHWLDPANSAENEALIGRPHLRGAREVRFVADRKCVFPGART